MVIYFDESYDNNLDYLILAALFNPDSKSIHQDLMNEKRNLDYFNADGTTKELKYNEITGPYNLKMAKLAVEVFMRSKSYFRCIVISQSKIDLNLFGKSFELEAIKKARMYKKFAELLIARNSKGVEGAILLADAMTRCQGDEFIEVMKREFCFKDRKYSTPNGDPILKDVIEIKSHLDQYHVNQINDVLAGCVLNNLKPTKNKHKNDIRNCLVSKLNVLDLLPNTWEKYDVLMAKSVYPKFNIWYWKPK